VYIQYRKTTLQFLSHISQPLYMCTVCDSTDSYTTIQFVPNCL
jgi:hypothetical protein